MLAEKWGVILSKKKQTKKKPQYYLKDGVIPAVSRSDEIKIMLHEVLGRERYGKSFLEP